MTRSTFVLVAVCGLVVWASEARAQVELATAVEPAHVAYPHQRVLSYRLAMTSGEREERLSVAPDHVPFANRVGVTLDGPGALGHGVHGDPSPLPAECPRWRTMPLPLQYYTVVLPPRPRRCW